MSLKEDIREGEELVAEFDKPGQSEKGIRLAEHARVALILAKAGEEAGFDPARTLRLTFEGLAKRQEEISNGVA